MPETPWSLYLLISTVEERTYVGVTLDVDRRLRQHNGEQLGGAKATRRGRPWKLHTVLGMFPNRSEAQQAEAVFKRKKGADRMLAKIDKTV
ncbi:MAG: GIY-YIG nuclease family protein [Planctomycetota bacterium]